MLAVLHVELDLAERVFGARQLHQLAVSELHVVGREIAGSLIGELILVN